MTKEYRLALRAVLLLGLSLPIHADPVTFAETNFNPNYVTSSLGLRDVGPGTMTISGITAGANSAALTPEPRSLLLVGAGLVLVGLIRRRRA